ncbi:MAG TPA: hypothetical protein VNI20_07185 [Fimbriimonadaceae bacterium]|nr:hypothetical protein [Fimbriimonadaceae bacterium]
MQRIVAGLMALTAMGASILAHVDPLTVVVRGGIALVVGFMLTGLWTMIVMPQAEKPKKHKAEKVESDENVEDDDEEQEEAA